MYTMYQHLNQSLCRHSENVRLRELINRQSRLSIILRIVLISLLWLSNSGPAWTSERLSELNEAQRVAITQLCTPLHFRQGAVAYRACLRQELSRTQPNNELGEQPYAQLSIDEQYAIQRACIDERASSADGYHSCTREQLEKMQQEPEPDLSGITKDEQYVLSQQCFQTQTTSGAQAYRECINTALASLNTLPKADFSPRSNIERNNIQLECSISSGDVSGYRKCLLNALGIAFAQVNTPAVTADRTENTPKEKGDVVSDSVASVVTAESASAAQSPAWTPIEAPSDDSVSLVEQHEQRPPSSATDSDPTNPATLATDIATEAQPATQASQTIQKITSSASQLLAQLQSQFEALKPVHWIVLLTTLGISSLLLLISWMRKADDKPRSAFAGGTVGNENQPNTNQHKSASYAPGRPDLAPATANRATLSSDKGSSLNETFIDGLSTHRYHDEPARYHVPTPSKHATQGSVSNNMKFVDWLQNFKAIQQQEYAIEFLIYWMAYADNRFDPELKQRVFQMKNPDIPNLIKRWVFMKDAYAFSDAIAFLQSHTSTLQRRQIIDLLLALLVNERAITPAQNNLLRFLADAFGVGKAVLNEQFSRAYGEPMPAVPRPDKILWWDQITPEQKLRWDARATARQSPAIRCKIMLGQPLQGELDKVSIDKSFHLAMDRCDGKRVNLLGEREASLLATQRDKFEAARNTLTEAIA